MKTQTRAQLTRELEKQRQAMIELESRVIGYAQYARKLDEGRRNDELKPGEDYSWIKPIEELGCVDGRLVATLRGIDEVHGREVRIGERIYRGEDIEIRINKRKVYVYPLGYPFVTWNVDRGPRELIRQLYSRDEFGELFYHGGGARGGHSAPYQVYAEVKQVAEERK